MTSQYEQLEETNVVTEDMRLPAGSTVIQCILHVNEDGQGGHMDFRCVTIGAAEYDPGNPAHRFLTAVSNRMPEIMAEITGGQAVHLLHPSEIEERLLAANDAQGFAYQDAPQPGEVLTLSDGTQITVADESVPANSGQAANDASEAA